MRLDTSQSATSWRRRIDATPALLKAVDDAGDKWKDVTGRLPDRAGVLPVIALSSTNYNEAFGGDPAPGIPKMLKIQYRIDGKPGEVALRENDPLRLPVPP